MKVKTEIFDKKGNVVAGLICSAATYVRHDKDIVMVHLSETDKISKEQIVAIGNALTTAGRGKTMTQISQHSKNVLGFTLAKEPDAAKSKASIQVAYNAVVAEAKRVNAQQNGGNNGAQQQSRGNQSGNGGQQSQGNQGQQNGGNNGTQQQTQGNNAQSRGNQSGNGGQQPQGNQGQQNGGNAQQSNNNAQSRGNQSGNGGQQSQGNQGQQNGGNNGAQRQAQGNNAQQSRGGNQSGNGGQQSQGNQGQQNGGNAQQSNNNAQQPDKTKDIFGRPLKQSYPGLFWPGMSPQEEQAAFDSYWDMVHHVDKDIFHKK